MPKIHAAFSGFSCIAGRNAWSKDLTQHSFVKLSASHLTGAFCFFFSPTIRFRFSKIEENFSGVEGRFQNDEEYEGLAYRTKQAVEPWRIGLTGSLITGLNFSWYSRVKANPWKVLTGVVQLVCALVMAILYFHIAIANPISVTVGMLLA